DGITATRHMAEGNLSTRVVILSMHATSEHIFQALAAGANGYVLKESAGRDVVAAVLYANAGRRYFSDSIAELLVRDYVRAAKRGDAVGPMDSLSLREREVLHLVVEGRTSAEIAGQIHLSPKTVETYRTRLMKKLRVGSRPELVRFAISNGLISA
ncbi:response regulator transcription factor, partial [Candidatus Poribacteria bacterium]|nr:response regulator transcription factor [Candidatus Poribacteria bacterium]